MNSTILLKQELRFDDDHMNRDLPNVTSMFGVKFLLCVFLYDSFPLTLALSHIFSVWSLISVNCSNAFNLETNNFPRQHTNSCKWYWITITSSIEQVAKMYSWTLYQGHTHAWESVICFRCHIKYCVVRTKIMRLRTHPWRKCFRRLVPSFTSITHFYCMWPM